MSGRDLDHLYEKHRARVDEWLQSHEQNERSGDDSFDYSRSSADADSTLSIIPPAYLSMRLSGESIRRGSIDAELFDDVVVPLQSEIRAASRPNQVTRLELVSITSGSTVLHFEPRVDGDITGSLSGVAFDPSDAIDESISSVLNLHDLLERESPNPLIETGATALFDGLARLTGGLIKHEAELELLWRPPRGGRRPSRLGRQGIAYAQTLFSRREVVDVIDVWGYVYSISLTGHVTLKRSVLKRNSRTFIVEVPDGFQILATFQLNALASLRVERTSIVDQIGRTLTTTYRLVRVLEHQPQLAPGDEPE